MEAEQNVEFKSSLKNVVNITLTPQERTILEGITKSDYFNSINPYLLSILLEGGIENAHLQEIIGFISDWRVENVGEALPQPMRFLELAIISKADGDYSRDPSQVMPVNNQQFSQNEPVSNLDYENLPTYLPKIYDMIEKEVQRRVKVEMKEYNQLVKKHEELKLKFQHISKMFSVD